VVDYAKFNIQSSINQQEQYLKMADEILSKYSNIKVFKVSNDTNEEELKNKIFVFKDKFYADEKDVDILFRTMHASTVNKSLLRKYGSLYRNRRLDYVKEVAAMAIKEFPKYNLTLDEAEKQFMDLCELIDKYYNEKPKLVVGSRKSKSQLQKPKYFIETMQVMLKKTMPSSK